MNRNVPPRVQQTLLAEHQIEELESFSVGLSGASIFRCRDRRGRQFALRRWPSDVTRDRIREVHRVMNLARRNGCLIVPRLFPASPAPRPHEFFITAAGRYWELAEWMPGQPLPADAAPEKIRLGVQAITQFHHAVRGLGVTEGAPPSVQMRRQRCRELNRQLPSLLESFPTSLAEPKRPAEPQLIEALEKARRLLQREWSAVSRRIDESMKRYESMRLPLQYVLRDIHGQHLLFQPCEKSGSCVATGLIDFDAVRVDTPIADWARWIGSFAASRSAETWNRVLADLADPRPFPTTDSVLPLGIFPVDGLPIDRGERSQNSRWLPSGRTVVAMARELAFATAWISLANWLVWIAGGERDFSAATERVTQRITKWVFFCESESLGSLG